WETTCCLRWSPLRPPDSGEGDEPLRGTRSARIAAAPSRRAAAAGGSDAGSILTLAGLAHVPWQGLWHRVAAVTNVRVVGARALDPGSVLAIAGIARGVDPSARDLDRARQRLLLEPRVAKARVLRSGLRGVEVRIEERVPVLR